MQFDIVGRNDNNNATLNKQQQHDGDNNVNRSSFCSGFSVWKPHTCIITTKHWKSYTQEFEITKNNNNNNLNNNMETATTDAADW